MLSVLLLVLHAVVSILLIAVVLMQSGRGGGLAGAFGGGGNQSLFGARGATSFLTKTTWILGAAYLLTSLVLALTIGRLQGTSTEPRSLLRENPVEAPAPAIPGTVPGGPIEQAPGGPAEQAPVAPETQQPETPSPSGN